MSLFAAAATTAEAGAASLRGFPSAPRHNGIAPPR